MGHKYHVLLFVPNVIGYLRVGLILIGCCLRDDVYFLIFVCMSAMLDMIDGMIARQLQQESAFGEWLDVVIDLFTRGLLWCLSYPSFGFMIFGFEFLVFCFCALLWLCMAEES